MPSHDPEIRHTQASVAGLTGWVNTPDRQARMAHVRANSPTDWPWHARKLGIDPETATDDEIKRALTARKLWYRRWHLKLKATRKAAKARELQAEADRLQAVAEALDTLDEGTGA